jgi:uncharacterized protein DUF5989
LKKPHLSEFEQLESEAKIGFFREYWQFLKESKKWWLLPILIVFLLLGILVILGGSGAAPFIYTLF